MRAVSFRQQSSKLIAKIRRTRPPRQGFPMHKKAWLVWAVSAAFVLFQFILQLSSGEIIGDLMKSFALSAFGGGVLASAYYYVYAALQTPAGMLIDRYGPRRLLSLGALVLMLGSFLFGASHDMVEAVLGRLLMGSGAAFAFVGSINLISCWFPAERFGIMVAIAETIGMCGSVLGGYLLALFVQRIDWRYSMLGAAVIALVLAVMLWTIVRDRPANVTPITARPKGTLWPDLKQLLRQKVCWFNGLYTGLMFAVATVFTALWGIPFLQVEHHLSLIQATVVANMLFVGIALGGPFMGWLDTKIRHRRMILIVSALASTVFMSAIIYLPQLSLSMVITILVLLGVVSSAYVINYVIGNEIAASHARSTSIGFVNTLAVGTAPILQPLVGLLLLLMAGHLQVHGATHYSLIDYQVALIVMPLVTLGAAVLACFIPNKPVAELVASMTEESEVVPMPTATKQHALS